MTFPGYFLSHVNNVSSILLCLPHLDDRPRKHTQLRHQFIPDCVRKEVSTHYYSLHDSPSLYQRLCSSNSLSKMADLCFWLFFLTQNHTPNTLTQRLLSAQKPRNDQHAKIPCPRRGVTPIIALKKHAVSYLSNSDSTAANGGSPFPFKTAAGSSGASSDSPLQLVFWSFALSFG